MISKDYFIEISIFLSDLVDCDIKSLLLSHESCWWILQSFSV